MTTTKGRSCDGKIGRTKADAKQAAASMRRRFLARRVHAYKCPHCGMYHVGHQPRGRRANP